MRVNLAVQQIFKFIFNDPDMAVIFLFNLSITMFNFRYLRSVPCYYLIHYPRIKKKKIWYVCEYCKRSEECDSFLNYWFNYYFNYEFKMYPPKQTSHSDKEILKQATSRHWKTTKMRLHYSVNKRNNADTYIPSSA